MSNPESTNPNTNTNTKTNSKLKPKKHKPVSLPESETNPAWVKNADVYTAMGDALYAVPPTEKMAVLRPPSPLTVRPKPSANVFYEKSRFYFSAPLEPQPPLCTSKVCCDGTKAVWKCHSCVKFDARGKGWYCSACFNKHHPWFRDSHSYVPISEGEN